MPTAIPETIYREASEHHVGKPLKFYRNKMERENLNNPGKSDTAGCSEGIACSITLRELKEFKIRGIRRITWVG